MEKKIIRLIVDVQVDFVTGALRNEHAIPVVPHIVEFVKEGAEKGYTMVFTKDTHKKETYASTLEGATIPPHCIEHTEGWEIVPELKPYTKDEKSIVITKETFAANWAKIFENKTIYSLFANADEIQVVGFVTSICVASQLLTLRGWFPNKKIVLYSNLTADLSPKEYAAALSVAKSCQIEIREY